MLAALIAVPLPDKIPVTVVERVRAGVVPPEEVPANPLAVFTDTVVTAPEPRLDHTPFVYCRNTCEVVL